MATPNTTTSAPSAPSETVTFTFSYGDLFLTNLSKSFSFIDSDNQANTSAAADGGTATVHNDAVVETDITEALTFATSSAFGENKNHFGLAETQATIVGNLFLDAGKNFSFDFTSTLDIETSIDVPQQVEARTSGEITFSLYDTSDIRKEKLTDFLANLLSNPNNIQKKPLVFFSLSGNLNTSGNENFLTSKKSDNVTISTELKDSNFAGNEKFASTFIRGSVKQSFNNSANVTLVVLRRGQAKVTVSEQSRRLTLLSTPGSQVMPIEGRRPGTPLSRYSNRKVITYTVGK